MNEATANEEVFLEEELEKLRRRREQLQSDRVDMAEIQTQWNVEESALSQLMALHNAAKATNDEGVQVLQQEEEAILQCLQDLKTRADIFKKLVRNDRAQEDDNLEGLFTELGETIDEMEKAKK